jgi:hypothetical protein
VSVFFTRAKATAQIVSAGAIVSVSLLFATTIAIAQKKRFPTQFSASITPDSAVNA